MLTSLVERSPLLRGMLDFAFPPLCAGCREFCESPDALCSHCLETINWLARPTYVFPEVLSVSIDDPTPPSIPVFASGDYSGPLRETILQVKFHHVTAPLGLLAKKLVGEFGKAIVAGHPTHLIPLPLHPTREYARGFNQAMLFAAQLGALLELPVAADLLYRTARRRPQSRLSEARRAANIRGVFGLDPDCSLDPQSSRLILVDDVVTSGHTILEAERTLRASGFTTVAITAIARTL